jgi:hypothetical protein
VTLRRPAIVFTALVVVLAAGVCTMHWIRSGEPLALDQGLFACFTRWVPRGWLPYRDIFDSKPPLFLYSWALAAAMPGDIATAMWRLETLWIAGSMVATFVLVRRMTGDRFAALASAALLFVGLWCPAWGGYWSRAQAEELAVLPIMLAATLALREPTPRRLIALGALTGVVGLFKIPAMAVAAAWPVMWLADGWRRVPARAGWALAGLALPWLVVVAFFAAHGALGDFVDGVFVYHRHNAAFIAPPWGETIVAFVRTICSAVPELLLLAAVGLVSLPRRERLFVGAWIGSTMVAVVLQRQLADYHYLLIAPGLAVAAGCGLVAAVRALGRASVPWHRAAAAAVLFVFVALATRTGAAWARAYGADASFALGRISRPAFLATFTRGIVSPAVEDEAAAYLREHTQSTDRILVWGLAPGIYALADRAPATKYPFHKILMTDAPLSRLIPGLAERRADYLARVAADPPIYVLVGRRDENGFEPQDSFTSLAAFPELHQILRSDYHLETEIGRFVVLRRGAP